MQSPFVLLLSASALLALSPLPRVQDRQDERPALSKTARLANRKLLARMQGAWRLVDMQLVEQDKSSFGEAHLDHIGFCLVSGGYLSIEFHLRLATENDRDQGRSLVTGLHRFDLGEHGELETTTVIGTNTDPRGAPEFEPPGTKRSYRIELAGDAMTLARDDGHTLIFERLQDDRSRFDIFGRPVREKPDIFNDEEPIEGEKQDGGKEKGGREDGGG